MRPERSWAPLEIYNDVYRKAQAKSRLSSIRCRLDGLREESVKKSGRHESAKLEEAACHLLGCTSTATLSHDPSQPATAGV